MALKIVATSILTLIVISLVTFAATNLKSPEDIARAALGRETPTPALVAYAEEHGLAAVALRYSNVYGPRQNPHGEAGVVAIFCKKLLAGEPATINGDGRYVRDYVYGPDVARANLIALTADLPAVQPKTLTSLNIGTGLGTDVNELESQIGRAHV